MGVVPGDAEGELDHVEPADIDRPGRIEADEDGSGDGRAMAPHQGRSALRQLA